MKLYYTTTAKVDAPQQKPTQSLGGFKSSSPIPNSAFGNLFPDISLLTIEKKLPEYIGLILINERPNPVSEVKIWINNAVENICNYKIAVVELNSRNEFETLPSGNSKPLFAEFYTANNETDAIIIGEMVINEQYGLWLERSINADSGSKDCSTLEISSTQIEEMDIKIAFKDDIITE